MIIPALGKLSLASDSTAPNLGQDITASDEDCGNVIQLPAADYIGFTDLWWVVDTAVIAAGDDSDTFTFALVMSQEAALTTNKEVASVSITDIADLRLATVGRHIVALNVGLMMANMLDTDASDYPFIGQTNVLSTGATISIHSVLQTSVPRSEPHRMTVTSPVTIPQIASVGSGFVA